MSIAAEFLLALFATIGLIAIFWLAFGKLLTPSPGARSPVCVILPVKGDGTTLEQTIHHLLWLEDSNLSNFTIVIADYGLSDLGLLHVRLLLAQNPALLYIQKSDHQ